MNRQRALITTFRGKKPEVEEAALLDGLEPLSVGRRDLQP